MRTSLIETRNIEQYLLGRMPEGECLLIEAKMTLEPEFREKVDLQQQVQEHIQAYGRQQLKAEVKAIHHKLFSQPRHTLFKQRVLSLFKT